MDNETGAHRAHAAATNFSFSEDRHLGVFVCSHVAAQAPILFVSHDADGDWQFLCGSPHSDAEGVRLVCLEHVVAADPSLNALAKLDVSQQARRSEVGAKWSVADPNEAFVQRSVLQFGWCVQGIDAEGGAPPFSYTIGLHQTFSQPELIVFGLPHDAALRLLNLVGERIREGQRFEPGVSYTGLVDAHDVRFRVVLAPASVEAHFGYALWYYGGSPFGVLQLIWPDAKGAFPDAPTAPDWLQKTQPLLA
jgi:hypothetical protein